MRRLLLIAWLLLASFSARAGELTVFAAASLTDALKEIGTQWAASGHAAPRYSFAASSTLARQIDQGAPANIFASADQKWMDYLAEKHLIAPDSRRNLLANELVLIAPATTNLRIDIKPGVDLLALLGPNGRIATGDPAHVPVGLYARQSLTKLGVWNQIEPRLARTEDVRAALLLVERGEAPLGIVYSTDAKASKTVAIAGVFPSETHEPVTYPFAVTTSGDTAEARAFLKYLSGPEAAKVFVARGFKMVE
ncbi:MAG: molybdate ABC transporter substrate-binding protein [Proteobacteria bacterium]|nr:molybdate ABC transporter substrate-binding protein [Pseudomonadota bacterium]